MIEITAISNHEAKDYLEEHSKFRGDFTLAIAAMENDVIHGVIVLVADGIEFALGHISTDGNAQVGSLLYGAAWRAAKSLGYKRITI